MNKHADITRTTPASWFAAAILCLLPALLPMMAHGQADRQSARSVLRIVCDLPNGKTMRATGFVWHDSLHAVTALHAVAGCTKRIAYSEEGGSTPFEIQSVRLDADLALLKLGRNLALAPIQNVSTEPNVRDQFYTWGYPLGVAKISGIRTEFADGTKGGIMTLDDAYGDNAEAKDLFVGMAYPKPQTTKILRVASTQQPGQSGAPILDAKGQVVAVVDGGLLGGWRGLNWSIPAHIYLPGLLNSHDAIPSDPSKWAVLFSNVTPTDNKSVVLPQSSSEVGSGVGELKRVRTMSLSDLNAMLQRKGESLTNFDFIKQTVERPEEFARLTFDVYEDPITGATLGVPANMKLTWNTEMRALEAITPSGAVHMFIGVRHYDSYKQAKDLGKQAFVNKLVPLANWSESPAAMDFANLNDSIEWANNANFFPGIDRANGQPSKLLLSISVSGPKLLGYAVYGPKDIANLPTTDLVAYLMMQMAAQELSGFAAN